MNFRCVLGEMFMRRPILQGKSDIEQLEKIWQLCGTPNQHTWPNYDALPGCEGVKPRHHPPLPRMVNQMYKELVHLITFSATPKLTSLQNQS